MRSATSSVRRVLGMVPMLLMVAACGPSNRQTSAGGDVAAGSAATTSRTVDLDELDDQVERALRGDATLAPFRLDADDVRDHLVIEGTVQTDAQRSRAAQIAAAAAPGVRIDNQVRVNATAGQQAGQDADEAEDRVEDALEADRTLRAFDLDVDDDNGRLVLKGTVRTQAQRTQAEDIAKRVAPGIAIDNRIQVQ